MYKDSYITRYVIYIQCYNNTRIYKQLLLPYLLILDIIKIYLMNNLTNLVKMYLKLKHFTELGLSLSKLTSHFFKHLY